MHQHLTMHHDGPVATVTLNRPAVFNALNNGIKTELRSVFEALHDHAEVRVVVLTGAGQRLLLGTRP